MLIVAALGGNALLKRGEPLEAEVQHHNVEAAAEALAPLIGKHRFVVTHGNGPQVGLLALQAEAYREVSPYPLDVLGAESEGMIGYLIEQALAARLPDREIATLLTQVMVAPDDPAFAEPTKPIGPVYGEAEAHELAAARGWTVAADGEYFRRVVPSPEPKRILELGAIRRLVAAGVTVICAGGGGIPVVVDQAGAIRGVEAVIDKDLAAALLASELGADALLLLTDVAAVETDWGTTDARAVRCAAPDHLHALDFAPGSMGPKVEAACRFAEASDRPAAIGALADAAAILAGEAGTTVTTDCDAIEWEDAG
ncbi:MAG: carbamate kinase [Alphaproteobacteria bacterium]|nr:carbamate kinase [Alphaproteobacteria bacterium]